MYSGGMFVLKGILGILFGLLIIAFPDFALGAFLTLFGLLLISAGVLAFLFAVTSRAADTLFWFVIAGGIIVLGILAFFARDLFAIIFALMVAGWALVTGVWDLEKYICSRQRFYLIIGGLTGASVALIMLALYFLPSLRGHYLTTIFGIYAAIFGIFSFFLGYGIIRGTIPACLLPEYDGP